MSCQLSVILPMYNEEKIAADTAKTLVAFLDERFPCGDYEVLFVDDGSRDTCAACVRSLALPHVRVLGYSDNRGKGSAVREGVLAAEGESIVYTDCDLAYGCEAIASIAEKRRENGTSLTIGSRNLSRDGYEGYTLLRKLMSKCYIKVISLLAGFRYSDSQCGIKCLEAKAAKDIFSRCTVNGFAFDLEVLILADKLGYTISEMPVRIINHRESESKVSPLKDALRMIRDVSAIKKQHRNVKAK